MMVLVYDRKLKLSFIVFLKKFFREKEDVPSKDFTFLFGSPLSSLFLSDGMVASLAGEDLTCSQDDLFSLITVNGIWHCLEF